MPNKFEQFIRHAKTLKLNDEERAVMRRDVAQLSQGSGASFPARRPFTMNVFQFPTLSFAVGLVVVLFATTSALAERALPGDALYSMKVQVNENLLTAFAQSDLAKTKLQVALSERRLQEAETLAVEGKLDSVTQVALQQNFATHANNVPAMIARLQVSNTFGAADVSSSFTAALNAHRNILSTLVKSHDDEASVRNLLDHVSAARQDSSKLTASTEATAAADAAPPKSNTAPKKLKEVTRELQQLRRLLDRASSATSVNPSWLTSLNDVDAHIADATTKIVAGNRTGALTSLRAAEQTIQEVTVLWQTSTRLHVDAPSSQSEDAQPAVEPSQSERRGNAEQKGSRGKKSD